jgi:hypothetical protein
MDDYDELDAAALEILREHGPLTDEAWAKALVRAGHGGYQNMLDHVESLDSPGVGFFDDERNVALDGLLEGRILTHRLTQREIASDILEATRELTAIAGLVQNEDDASDFEIVLGAPFTPQAVFDDRGFEDAESLEVGLLLPRGTLAGYAVDDLVGLYVESGAVRLRRVAEPSIDEAMIDRLRALVPAGTPKYVDSVVWQLMYESPSAFREATVPLDELCALAGLAIGVDHVAREGTDPRPSVRDDVVDDYDTDEAAVGPLVMMLVHEVIDSKVEDPTQLIRRAIADSLVDWEGLCDPDTAGLTLALTLRVKGDGLAALASIAGELSRADIGLATGAAHWIRGKAVELMGDVAEAERQYELAVDEDPWFEPALYDLALFKSLRSNAEGAVALLNQLGTEEGDELKRALQQFIPRDHPELGRNDKCWCGSGRKYKVCHLGKSEASLRQKALWLYRKAVDAIIDGRGLDEMEALANIRYPDGDDSLDKAFADPFVVDACLFEGGFFASFVETFGTFLPAEELNLAQQWLLIERSAYEIESVEPGIGLSLRDIRTGDRLPVAEKTASRQLRVGEFICTRVVPIGDELQLFGGIEPVYPTQRTELIALLDQNPAPPEELVEFLSARLAPPQVTTRQGDPLVVCEATFELGELGNIKRKLSRRYGASRSGTWHWTVEGSVFGVLELDGSTLRVEAMSEPRFDELIEAVREMDPQARLLDESRTSAADTLAEPREKPEPVEHDPEILAILDERIRQHEASWIHESIPALDGYTPTEAAADPTRRDDLIRLLNSFPDTGQPGTMSPSRLRAALGLDDGSAFWRSQKS